MSVETAAPPASERAAVASPTTRMAMAVLALAGFFIALYMLLHKLGVIPVLACGEGGTCDVVQSSRWAVFLGIPVPAWGVAGYGAIFVLAMAGLQPRFADNSRIAFALLATASLALAFTLYLNALEAFVINAWCRWCIGSAIVATLLFLFALPELKRIRGRP
ncbi:MAG: vitamin K epoxide reductase family protein [Longimicrobiales bacterium]